MTSFHERFTGRAAIITGGASGVGFDTAKRLVAEGGSVALWDRDPQALARARAALGDAAAFEVDVTDWDLADYPIADWAQVININLTGVFLSCRALVPCMLRNNYGRIVNIINGSCSRRILRARAVAAASVPR